MARGERSPRGEHADRTRNALLEVALNLFSANGYDETTTDQIAESAGVSPRTFFRYFPTKESVLFFGEYDFIDAVSGVYLAQPEELSDFEAMANSFALLAPGLKRTEEGSRSTTKRSPLRWCCWAVNAETMKPTRRPSPRRPPNAAGCPPPTATADCWRQWECCSSSAHSMKWLSTPNRGLDDLVRQEFAALPSVLK